jgi:predicted amidophosphoribosyltransferase
MQERCPGCKAQVDTDDSCCYRCGMDFMLIRGAMKAALSYRSKALFAINGGDYERALQNAIRAYWFHHNQDTAKTLALTHMLCGHYHKALLLRLALSKIDHRMS